jgi:Glycosyl hydrolase family 12
MRRRLIMVLLVPAMVVAASSCGAAGRPAGRLVTLCGTQRTAVAGGYIVQNNRYGTTAPECVQLSGGTGFQVTQSSIAKPVAGGPGAYPSAYQGCHWGQCGSGGLSVAPIRVANLIPGSVNTSWSTVLQASGAWNAAYDIWFGKMPSETGHPDCTELMVWLSYTDGVRPFGTPIATGVSIGDYVYDVWAGQQRWGDTITYEMAPGISSVTGLDIGTLAQDAVSRGYLSNSCYLLDIEAGFEIWQAGAGLTTSGFTVRLPPG